MNGTLVVPSHKPDIERILRVTSTPVINKTAVISKKVVFSGHVLIHIEYVACVPGNSQPVHFVSFKAPFADFIDDPCAHPGQNAELKVEVEFQEFHTVSKRSISKLIVLKICLVKLKEKGCDCAPHPCPPPCSNPCPPHKGKDCCKPQYNGDMQDEEQEDIIPCEETIFYSEPVKFCPHCGKTIV